MIDSSGSDSETLPASTGQSVSNAYGIGSRWHFRAGGGAMIWTAFGRPPMLIGAYEFEKETDPIL
jgi:hypothetical protein